MKKIASLGVLSALIVTCSVIIQPVSALENSWISRPPMLESAGRAVAADGKIYAIGADGIVQEYNPIALTWTKKASMPNPTGGGIAVYQNKIYIIGDNYNEVYDLATDTWTSKTAMPTKRTGIQANVVSDKIYLMGGVTESGTILDVNEAYDPATDTWTTKEPIPTPVYLYASAVVDNKIFIIGGSAEPPNVVLDLVQIYDPQNDSWTTGTPMPTAVRYASAVSTTGLFAPKRIYVIGGLQSGNGLNLNQVYDPKTDSWTKGTSMPTARYDLGVAVVNDTIYAMGGVLLPPYAFPKEPLTTNEVYLPIGYEGPLPPHWEPTPSPSISPSASPSPTINPTLTPKSTPTQSPSPSAPPEDDSMPIEIVLVTIAVAAIVIPVVIILIIRKRAKNFPIQ
jgi:N-acetylneuraminic acid mutarotase